MTTLDALSSAVLDSLPNHIAILDSQGTVLRVNLAWWQFVRQHNGTSAINGHIGMSYLDICRMATFGGEEERARVLAGLEAVLAGSRSVFFNDYLQVAGPEPRWFEMRVVPLAMPEGGAIVSHLDITTSKRAETDAVNRLYELAHVSRAVTMGALAGSAAHELSQPLTAILSNAQAALRFLEADPPRLDMVGEILRDIASADQRASEIIRRIRRLLKKGEPEERVAVDINDVVREAEHVLSDEALLRKVRITSLHEPGLSKVAGDPVQLQQVVLNLVMNAIEAMDVLPPPERSLLVRTAQRDRDHVEIVVHDCGPGVEEASLARIFEPFHTTKPSGLGMGLYITRAIVESHGGRIAVTRGAERGLLVSVTLPVHMNQPS